MASIKPRQNRDGSTSYIVLFRNGGKQTSKTFADEKSADKFKGAVDSVGPDAAVQLLTPQTAGRTVDSLFTEWLANKKPDMTLEAHRDYERIYAKWIKPTFGWRDAELVNEREVQAWVDKTLKPKLGAKSVAKNHALLHGMYKWASSKTVGHIHNDPCTETKLPKKKRRPPKGFTFAESNALLWVCTNPDEATRAAADVIAAASGTGWRPGEVLGLRAGAVDLDHRGRVFITMLSVYRRSEGIVDDGKTEAAGRRLQIFGPGAAVVANRAAGKRPDEPLFPHPTTGKEWNPQSFGRHYWPKVIEAAGLTERGPTPYWLRHTHVALCHLAGLSLPQIQRRMGHKSIQTTIDIYGQMIEDLTEVSAATLNQLLTPVAPAEMTEAVALKEIAGPK